jgi:hypothetical protein
VRRKKKRFFSKSKEERERKSFLKYNKKRKENRI